MTQAIPYLKNNEEIDFWKQVYIASLPRDANLAWAVADEAVRDLRNRSEELADLTNTEKMIDSIASGVSERDLISRKRQAIRYLQDATEAPDQMAEKAVEQFMEHQQWTEELERLA